MKVVTCFIHRLLFAGLVIFFAGASLPAEAAPEVEMDFYLQGIYPSFPKIISNQEIEIAGGPVFFQDQNQTVRGVLRLRNLDKETLQLEGRREKWTDHFYVELKKGGTRLNPGNYRVLWGKPAASKDVRKLRPGEAVELPFEIETTTSADSKILSEGQYRFKVGLNTLEAGVLAPLLLETEFRNFRVRNLQSKEDRFNYLEYLYQQVSEGKGNEERARQLLEEMIALEPADDLTLARLGDFYFFKRDYAKALPFFEKLLKTLEAGGRKRLLGWQSEYLEEDEVLELAREKAEAARRLMA